MYEDSYLDSAYEDRYESFPYDELERDWDEPYDVDYHDGVDDPDYEVTGCDSEEYYRDDCDYADRVEFDDYMTYHEEF